MRLPGRVPGGILTEVLKQGRNHKGRLLHYFPQQQQQQQQQSTGEQHEHRQQCQQPDKQQQQDQGQDYSKPIDEHQWCGWHTDHGSLTGEEAAFVLRGMMHDKLKMREQHAHTTKSWSSCIVDIILSNFHSLIP
jgi:hypothetical protein